MSSKKAFLILFASLLAGCATQEPLYQWGNFTGLTYDSLRGAGKSPTEQIDLMVAHSQRVQQAGKKLPPGFHAHLALLYLKAGLSDAAKGHFEAEVREFPESARYISSLMKTLNQPSDKTQN